MCIKKTKQKRYSMTLHDEIFQQAGVLACLLDTQQAEIERIGHEIKRIAPSYVFLAARGTSNNAGKYASYLWGSVNRLPVVLASPSLFTFYKKPPTLKDALVIGISQSGKSPDIVSVLEEGRKQGRPTLAVTNVVDSPLAKAADFVVDIQAGEEKAVAATKTYTTTLMAIAMLSAALAGNRKMQEELKQVPDWVTRALDMDEEMNRIVERYRFMNRCVVLGRGYNYATAFEWALKLKEMTYVLAEPHSSAEFLHGPMALVDQGFPVLTIAPQGKVFSNILELLVQLRRDHSADLLVISDQAKALEIAQTPVKLPSGIPEWLSPLIAIILTQLFSYHLTQTKGFNTETPRFLQKVTETH